MDNSLPNQSFTESAISHSAFAPDAWSLDQSLCKLLSAAAAASSAGPLPLDTSMASSSDAFAQFPPPAAFVPFNLALPAGASSIPQMQAPFTPLLPTPNQLQLQNANIAFNASPAIIDANKSAELPVNAKSVAKKFLTMFYNQMHCNVMELKRFYSFAAHIEREFAFLDNRSGEDAFVDTSKYYKDPVQQTLAVLAPIQDIVVQNVVSQKCFQKSILVQVSGTMRITLSAVIHSFSQTFIIYRADVGYWLIENDILRVDGPVSSTPSSSCSKTSAESPSATNLSATPPELVSQTTSSNSYSTVAAAAKGKSSTVSTGNEPARVNSATTGHEQQQPIRQNMVNKFYQDSSYQKFRNEFAIFIRGIGDDITHQHLGSELMAALNNKATSESKQVNVVLSYIDINYNKHFAFVYFGNEQSLNLALSLKQLWLNSSGCSIERKYSYNRPRRGFVAHQASSYSYEGY